MRRGLFAFAIILVLVFGFQNCSQSFMSGSDLPLSTNSSDFTSVTAPAIFTGNTTPPSGGAAPLSSNVSGFDVIAIGGQSNAVGFGTGVWSDAAYNRPEINAHIWQVGRASGCAHGHVDFGIYQLDGANDVLDNWGACKESYSAYGLSLGLGPELGQTSAALAFARRYYWNVIHAKGLNRDVIIVPGAYGGTNSYQWWDERCTAPGVNCPKDLGSWTDVQKAQVDAAGGLLYDLANRIHAALNYHSKPNKLVAILWLQGESDLNCVPDSIQAANFLSGNSCNYPSEIVAARNLATVPHNWNYWEWFSRTVQVINWIKINTGSNPKFLMGAMVPSFQGWGAHQIESYSVTKTDMASQARKINQYVSNSAYIEAPSTPLYLSGCDVAIAAAKVDKYINCSITQSAHFTNQAQVSYGEAFFQNF
jgi:hypothetical protein